MEQEIVDPNYKKGFNLGYWLQKGDPNVCQEVMRGNAKCVSIYAALKAGRDEAIREQVRERMEEADKAKQRDKDKGFDMG